MLRIRNMSEVKHRPLLDTVHRLRKLKQLSYQLLRTLRVKAESSKRTGGVSIKKKYVKITYAR